MLKEVYSEPSQTFKIELFEKLFSINYFFKTIFAKSSILGVLLSSKRTSCKKSKNCL